MPDYGSSAGLWVESLDKYKNEQLDQKEDLAFMFQEFESTELGERIRIMGRRLT